MSNLTNLSNGTYDKLKFAALIILPAAGALYFAVAEIWSLPNPDKVVGTITAIVAFLGVILRVSSNHYTPEGEEVVGRLTVMGVDENENLVQMSVDIDDPLALKPGTQVKMDVEPPHA